MTAADAELVEQCLALWNLIKQFEDGALRRRHYQRPFPMAPGLSYEAIWERISADIPASSGLAALRRQVARDGSILEELPGPVKDELGVQFQLGDPAGRCRVAIEVDFARAGSGQIVSESLEFECCPAAHGERAIQQSLKRYDHMLPEQSVIFGRRGQLSRRPTIHAAGYLIEPAMRYVLAPKGAGVALALKPSGVDEQPLGKVELQPV